MDSCQWLYLELLDMHLFFHFELIKNIEFMCSSCEDRFRLRLCVTGIDRNRKVRLKRFKYIASLVAAGI